MKVQNVLMSYDAPGWNMFLYQSRREMMDGWILPGQWTLSLNNPTKLVHMKPLHTSVNVSSDAECKTLFDTHKNTSTVSSGVIWCRGAGWVSHQHMLQSVWFPAGLPERVALYFVSGICAGLVFLLCLFGLRSTIVRDVKELVSELNEELKASRRRRKELMEDLFDDDISDTSSFRRLTQSYRTNDILSPSTMTVEMVDREVERPNRDLPNGDIWPHRDSSPYAIHKIKTYNNWETSRVQVKLQLKNPSVMKFEMWTVITYLFYF